MPRLCKGMAGGGCVRRRRTAAKRRRRRSGRVTGRGHKVKRGFAGPAAQAGLQVGNLLLQSNHQLLKVAHAELQAHAQPTPEN